MTYLRPRGGVTVAAPAWLPASPILQSSTAPHVQSETNHQLASKLLQQLEFSRCLPYN